MTQPSETITSAIDSTQPSTIPKPLEGIQRLLVIIAVMLSAIMVLIDLTIANVALPHMMGALGVTSDQITWVLTSYSMAEAICIPLASYLSLRFGVRKLMMISVSGFVIFSALCGQADSMAEMVFFRIFQGAFGASVIPLSQSVMVQVFPPEERGKAMALFSVGVLLGPILGPSVGGVITEHFDWRWIFYVNLPVGLLCLGMIASFVKLDGRGPTRIDWPLVIAMAIGIGLLQMVLDQGNQDGWFSDNRILFASIISALALFFFVVRSFKTKGDIAPMWLLTDRNLWVSCIMMAIFMMGLFGITQLQPMLMEDLLNYPVETTGFIMGPRGLMAASVLLVMAQFMDRLDSRMVILVGLCLNALASYFMTQYTLEMDEYWLIMPSLIQGAGMGLVFAPLSQLAYQTLAPKDAVAGAVVFNLFRTIGGSFGISIVNTYFSRQEQQGWQQLGGALSPNNILLQQQARLQDTTVTDPSFMESLNSLLSAQSSMLAFVHSFGFIMVSYVLLIPLLLLFKSNKPARP